MKTKGRRVSSNVEKAPAFKGSIKDPRGSLFALAAQKRAIQDFTSHEGAKVSKDVQETMRKASVADQIKIAAKKEGRGIAGKAIFEYNSTGKKPNISEFDKKKYKDSMNIKQTQVTPGDWKVTKR